MVTMITAMEAVVDGKERGQVEMAWFQEVGGPR